MSEPKNIKDLLIEDEGYRQRPYYDTADQPQLTIGVGRNLTSVGISKTEALFLLDNDIACSQVAARNLFSNFDLLNSVRQDVLACLIFNMGAYTVSGFHQLIAAVQIGDFATAANELLDSKWATQVGKKRSFRLAYMLEKGEYP